MNGNRESRRQELAALSKAKLGAIFRKSGYVWSKYPPETWHKEEIVNSILDLEYPPSP